MFENHRLTVAPYYDSFGLLQPGSGTQPCWSPPTVTVDFDPRIVQFVVQTDAVRSRIEASLSDLSPGCTITWPDSTSSDSGTVEISFPGYGASNMTKTCKHRLTELMDMMEVGNVDVLQDMWPQFVEQWKKQFDDKSVLVQLDEDKHCVHVVGEQKKCRETMDQVNRLKSVLVEEIRRSKMRVSECVSDISQHKLSLLQTCGFFQTGSADSLTVSVTGSVIVLEGQPDKVMEWKMKLYEKLNSAESETVSVDEYVLAVLKQEPFRQHLDQLLQPIAGVVWYTAGKKIEVYGDNKDKVRRLVLVIASMVTV